MKMDEERYKIFKLKLKLAELNQTLLILNNNLPISLFNAQKANFFKLDNIESLDSIKEIIKSQVIKEINQIKKDLVSLEIKTN